MNRMEHARALRDDKEVHYNCCQAVLVTFADKLGLSEEQAFTLGSNFGSGMRHGATCGTITGALMALGMMGYSEQEATALLRQIREKHGATDCATLLRTAHERGEARKDHCDGLVYEIVEALEEIVN